MKIHPLIILTILAGCDRSDPPAARPAKIIDAAVKSEPESAPSILIDALHAMQSNQTSARPYLSAATDSIILDGTKYPCRDPKHMGRLPNVVQVLYDRSEYALDWPATGKPLVTLDASSMRVLQGNPFQKFAPGGQAIIAVGYRDQSGKGPSQFDPFWVGSVLFR